MQTRKRKTEHTSVTTKKTKSQQDYLSNLLCELKIQILDYVPLSEYPMLRYVCKWMRNMIKIETIPQLGKVFCLRENRGWVMYPGVIFDHFTQYKSETLWEAILKNYEKFICGDVKDVYIGHAAATGCISNKRILKLAQNLFPEYTENMLFKDLMLRNKHPKLLPYLKKIMREGKKRLAHCMNVLNSLCYSGNGELLNQWVVQNKDWYDPMEVLDRSIYCGNIESLITLYNNLTYSVNMVEYTGLYDSMALMGDMNITKLAYYMIKNIYCGFRNDMGLQELRHPKNIPFCMKDGTRFEDTYITMDNYKVIIENLPKTAYQLDTEIGCSDLFHSMFHNVKYLKRVVTFSIGIKFSKEMAHFLFDRPIVGDDVPHFINGTTGVELLKCLQDGLFYYLWEKKCFPRMTHVYIRQMLYSGMSDLFISIGSKTPDFASILNSYKEEFGLVPTILQNKILKWLLDNNHKDFALWLFKRCYIPLRSNVRDDWKDVMSNIKLMNESVRGIYKDAAISRELHVAAIHYDSPELYDYLIANGAALDEDILDSLPDIVYDRSHNARWVYNKWQFPGRWCANIYAKHGEQALRQIMELLKLKHSAANVETAVESIKERSRMEITAKKYNIDHTIGFGHSMFGDYEVEHLSSEYFQ